MHKLSWNKKGLTSRSSDGSARVSPCGGASRRQPINCKETTRLNIVWIYKLYDQRQQQKPIFFQGSPSLRNWQLLLWGWILQKKFNLSCLHEVIHSIFSLIPYHESIFSYKIIPFIKWSFMHPASINTAIQSFLYSSVAHVCPVFVHNSSLYSWALSFYASLYSWVFGKFSWHQITDSRHILNSRQTSLSVRVGFNTNLKSTTKQSYCFVTDILFRKLK